MIGGTGGVAPGKAAVIWICGLSGAGKSTVAEAALARLTELDLSVLNLDGDVVREHLHTKLGFSRTDVLENNRGIAGLCGRKSSNYDVILVPVISPLAEARRDARALLGERYSLVYCDADIGKVRARDVKGLYARADRGEITDMIGYSAGGLAFEVPGDADLVLHTGDESLASCADRLVAFVLERIDRVPGTPRQDQSANLKS